MVLAKDGREAFHLANERRSGEAAIKKIALDILSIIALLVVLISGCWMSAPEPMPSTVPSTAPPSPVAEAKPLVIDTDMAVDDWMAILYLLQRPDVQVEAITVTGAGEAHCDPGIQNALGLLSLAGDPDVPVSCGRETPLQGNHAFPTSWREMVDGMLGLPLPSNPNPPSSRTAVELLISVIQSSPEKVVLVALGPLTNVAEALQSEPSLVDNLEMIYIMGGAVDVPGNLQVPGFEIDNGVAEWNIYVDPQAAAIVFQSGAPITLVALDATNDAPITMGFYRRLEAGRTTPEAEFVYQVLSRMQEFINSGEYFFWDPLAAAVATSESLVTIQPQTLKVIEEEGPESGRTLVAEDGSNVRLCTNADSPRFEELFLDTLNGRVP
jgi:inosine-uridine nucleoside N-ribohydrolase